MERDLIKFNENITKINKDIAKYEDNKGNYSLIPIGQLMCNCEYVELDEIGYKKALFEKLIKKEIKYNKIKTTKVVDKATITGKKQDQGTLVDKEIEVCQVWIVRNSLGISMAFEEKVRALAVVNEINDKYLKMAELK